MVDTLRVLRVISIILRIPLHLFLFGSLGASIYAAVNSVQGTTWKTPLLLGAIMLAWYIGVALKATTPTSNEIEHVRSL